MRRWQAAALGALLLGLGEARADRLTMEGSMLMSANFPTGTDSDHTYGAIGFSGAAGWEGRRLGFAVRGIGTITTDNSLHISAGSYDLSGELARREYAIEVLARYFVLDGLDRKRWYFEMGFLAAQTDFIHAQAVYVLPQSQDYTRFFIRGSGFSFALGYRPLRGPWFYQLTYKMEQYETLEITGDVKYLHPILAEPALNENYFIHSVALYIGLDVFGR